MQSIFLGQSGVPTDRNILTTNKINIPYSSRLDPGAPSEERKIEADVVVLAAGAWCPYLGELASGVSIPIIP